MDSEGYSVRVAYWVPDNYIHERNRTDLIQKIDERRYAALQDVLMAIITFALVAIFSWIATVEISAYASIVVALYPVVTLSCDLDGVTRYGLYVKCCSGITKGLELCVNAPQRTSDQPLVQSSYKPEPRR